MKVATTVDRSVKETNFSRVLMKKTDIVQQMDDLLQRSVYKQQLEPKTLECYNETKETISVTHRQKSEILIQEVSE